jgi:chloramphenicol O-acetyltransferase type B
MIRLIKKIARWLLGHQKSTNQLKRYARYSIGRGTYGMPKIHDWGDATLTIGSFCSIAGRVTIFLSGNHRTDWVTTFPFTQRYKHWPETKNISNENITKGDVIIGNDVWLGYDCLILSGVKIGHGAVIAARAVVTRDVPPFAIVAGNPARIIKKRFDDTTIERLLNISWWDWEDERIEQHLSYLLNKDIEYFLNLAEKIIL